MKVLIPFANEFSAFMLLIYRLKTGLKTRNRMGYYSLLNRPLSDKSSRLKYRKLISKGYKTMLLIACMSLSQTMLAQPSPIPMLERAANAIIATLKENKDSLKSNPDIIYKAVETHLLPNVDVAGMSRSVLGRQAWNKATPAERVQFSKAFTRLVIRTHSNPLAQYSDETIQFLPLRGLLNSRFMRVTSVIVRSEGQNIPLCYSLVSKY